MRITLQSGNTAESVDWPGVPSLQISRVYEFTVHGAKSRSFKYVYTYAEDDASGLPVYVLTSVAPVRVRQRRKAAPGDGG